MILALIAEILVQAAPFIAIIIVEFTGTSFLDRWDSKFKQYESRMFVERDSKKEFDNLAEYVHGYDNTIQHTDLTLLALVAIFAGRMISEVGSQQRNLMAILFISTMLIILAVRYRVEGHFEDMSPDKYAVKNSPLGLEYGTAYVILINSLILFVILAIELTPLLTG